MGIPASRKSRFMMSLSIPTAEPRMPAPTQGRFASLHSPWMEPSSPYGPWRTGKDDINDRGLSAAGQVEEAAVAAPRDKGDL